MHITCSANSFRSLLRIISVACFSSPALASSRTRFATLSLSSGHKSFRHACLGFLETESTNS